MTISTTTDTSSNIVCLFADHKYDDSMGAYTVFTLFNTETKEITHEGGMYSNTAYNAYTETGDLEILKEASRVWLSTAEEKEGIYNKYARRLYFAGCTVVLQRSRKAPNKTPLLVVGDIDGGYNSRFFSYDPDKIIVEVDGKNVAVSTGTIKEVVKGVYTYPVWYVTADGKGREYL